jgi:hypothetical protein
MESCAGGSNIPFLIHSILVIRWPVESKSPASVCRTDTKLAQGHRAGELTPAWIPDAAHKTMRDLVRARLAAKKDQSRARHRLSKLLLRYGPRPTAVIKLWTAAYLVWVKRSVRFDQPAQGSTLANRISAESVFSIIPASSHSLPTKVHML